MDYVILVLGSEVGLRRQEIAYLRVEDLHGDTMAVRGAKGGPGKPVPLTPNVAIVLERWLLLRRKLVQDCLRVNPSEPVPSELLLWKRGVNLHSYTPGTVTKRMQELGRSLGMRLSPHDLRRSCGRELFKANGKDLVAVKQLLRHESIETTMKYIGAGIEEARSAMMVRERSTHTNPPTPPPQ